MLVAGHIVSAAAIVGGWFVRFKQPTVTTSQWIGAIGMLLTGLALATLVSIPSVRESMGWEGSANHMKLGVKLVIGAVVFVAALIGHRKASRDVPVPTGLAHAVGGMGLVNILVATLW
nr:hypothetical protein [Micrococcus cohnii]